MQTLTIKQIRDLIKSEKVNDELLSRLKNDRRKGVQQLVKRHEKQQEAKRIKEAKFYELLQFDQHFQHSPMDYIAGVDEAGRGPLAGPVVAAAVILPSSFHLVGLNDSKQITENERQMFYEKITAEAISYHIVAVDNHSIDELNIYEATKKAMTEAILGLETKPSTVLIDAVPLTINSLATKSVVKGDSKSLSIAAASVLAKVTRDKIMTEIDIEHPEYYFAKNKGYGTKDHLEALEKYGRTAYHRLSFSPVNQY